MARKRATRSSESPSRRAAEAAAAEELERPRPQRGGEEREALVAVGADDRVVEGRVGRQRHAGGRVGQHARLDSRLAQGADPVQAPLGQPGQESGHEPGGDSCTIERGNGA